MMQDPRYAPTFTVDSTDPKDTGNSTCNVTQTVSTANLKSGNYYHSQSVITKPESLSFDLSYNSLESLDIPLGKGWTHSYNISLKEASGHITLKLGDGDILNFTLSGGIYLPDSSGADTTIIKNSDSTYTRTFKSGLTQNFGSTGLLTAITDANGNKTTMTYAGSNLSTIIDPTGRTLTITSSSGRISTIKDPAGNTFSFTYTGNLLSNVTDPAGNSWQYTYDANGKLTQKTDPAGNQSTNAYDATGKNISSTDPEGRTKTISYNIPTGTSIITEKDGSIWTRTYNYALNAPLTSADPLGNTNRYTYDSKGNMLTSTTPDGNTTSYIYDTANNLLTETDPLNHVTTYTYNGRNQMLTLSGPQGTITNSYNTKGNLLTATDPAGATTTFEYDAKGNVTKITNAKNQVTTLAYDNANQLVSSTDSAGVTSTFTYDANGNVLTATNAAGKTTSFEYDVMNRLTKVTDPLNHVTTYAYDKLGNKTSATDANGNTTTFTYNYRSQVTEAKDALGNVTTYAYGPTGCPSCGGGVDKLARLTDAKGQATLWQYDLLGRPTRETDPLGKATAYAYDTAGNLQTRTDANSAAISYTYDALRRLTGKSYPDATTQSFTYDAPGRLATATNGNVSYSYSYDAGGRLTSVSDSRGYVIVYEYDLLGNRTKMTFQPGTADERITSYAYDDSNRLASIASNAGTFTYAYDTLGRRSSLGYPNQVTTSYAYDYAGRLTSLGHATGGTSIASFTYTLDNTGNRMSKTVTEAEQYLYDTLYRLLTVTSGKPETFTYDPVGNRQTGPGAKDTVYLYTANQMTQGRKLAYGYDNAGNQTTRTVPNATDKSWVQTWNAENQLVKVEKTKGNDKRTVTFSYDPLGRRIDKQLTTIFDGVTKTQSYAYVYDGDNIAMEIFTDVDGTITKTFYTHGPGTDEHLALDRNGSYFYYHADGLGSITAITDATAAVMQSYTYDSYGMPKPTTNFLNSYMWVGKQYDRETGLYEMGVRPYDPMEGRFVSRDPLSFAGGDVNLYQYVSSNPVNWVDPSGLYVIGYQVSGSFGAYGVVGAGKGVAYDGKTLVNTTSVNGSAGPQFSASAGVTGLYAPFASNVNDLAGPSFDINLRLLSTVTISIPINKDATILSNIINFKNTSISISTPGLDLGLGAGMSYTKVGSIIKKKCN